MRGWLIRALGGIDLKSSTEEERQEILSLAIEQLFNTIGRNDILRQEGDIWFWEDKPLNKQQMQALKKEFQAIQNTFAFKVLERDILYQAQKKKDAAVTLMQLESAKLLQFTWDIIKTRLNEMRQLPQLPEA